MLKENENYYVLPIKNQFEYLKMKKYIIESIKKKIKGKYFNF